MTKSFEGIRLRALRLRRDMSACALPRDCCGGVSGVHGRLGRAGARRGLLIDEVATTVSFTAETAVLPSEARRDGDGVEAAVDPPRIFALPRFLNAGGHFLASPILGAGIKTQRVLHQFF